MRKFLVISIPICTIVIFILIMQSGIFLKYSSVGDDNIPKMIEKIMENISEEHWEEANKNTADLKEAWSKIVFRIQFSTERNEINDFSVSIARLEGAILARDKSSAFMELKEALQHWMYLGK
ncbi:DUF4363 family protein [Lutispora thermophila]|uniref:DUF4363 domain-containing protein n=1 Tax=Lutispora thermophila DSM 19022 TaxID=1122184 RepID=A0A1M6GUZ1_9FIRM|nr:DUF4363 family protein [Lutispora thermophila]SHJ13781.1 protein of unknown function [Lutispora thermophila DSM 19022]